MVKQEATPAPTPLPGAGRPAAETETAARSSANMAVGTLASRVLGFIKGILLGVAVAGSQVAGIFDTANNVPNIIYLLVAGGVFNAVLVPQVIKASKQPDKGADYISRLLTLAVIVLFALTALITILAGPIMTLLTTDYSAAQLKLATAFAAFLLPQIFFYGLFALLGQVLNAHGSFRAYAWAPVVNNIVAIAGLVTFIAVAGSNAASPHSVENWTPAQTFILAGSATLGILVQSLVLLWPLKRLGLRLRPRFGWRGVGLRATGKVAAWTMGTMLVGNLTFLLIGKIATIPTGSLPDGTVPEGQGIATSFELSRATEVYILPHSVVALSIATVLFTRMARSAANKDDDGLRATLSHGLRTAGVATVFGAIALLVLCGQFGMLFSASSRHSALLIATTLAILALGSPFLSANFMMNRAFYAAENAKTPFIIQSLLVIFGIGSALLAALLPANLIIFGLALSYTLGNIVAVVVTHFFLRSRLGNYGGAAVVLAHLRFLGAAVIAGIIGCGVLWLLGGFSLSGFAWQSIYAAALVLAVVGLVMAAVYFVALKLLRARELNDFLDPLLQKLRGRVPGLG
ncbi:virulence factor MviN [Paeniglutamicibacter antarcticus]|uniref:Virulence factor MviN n=1 Tax=Arthrobacter terrae TaxID=2935737 RepID=A0A931CP80_9MICC|nr:lipid II flippase MurJ [Arthrobacter terrae]MBG0738474.1 virulence factor MviN [Arthrobacter terrae]